MRMVLSVGMVVACLLSSIDPASAVPPQPLGTATFDPGDGHVNAVYEVAPHRDGFVIAGSTKVGTDNDFMVGRVNGDGSPDTSFGDGGTFTLDGMGEYDWAESVAVAPDGSIVAGGALSLDGNPHFTLVRLTSSGQLDPSFGDGGVVVVDPASGFLTGATAVAVRPDGRVVTTAWYNGSMATQVDLFVAQFTRDGQLDPTFGDGGVMTADRSAAGRARFEYAEDLALDRLGRVVVAGSTVNDGDGQIGYDAMVARLTSDGRLDLTFGGTGLVITDVGGGRGDDIHALALSGDDIVVAGTSYSSSGSGVLVARFDGAGQLDPGYGAATGVVPPAASTGTDVVVDTAGRAIAMGTTATGVALVRYTEAGTPDPSFGPDGTFVRQIGPRVDGHGSLSLTADGERAIVAGTTGPSFRPPQSPTADVFTASFGLGDASGYWLLSDRGAVYSFGAAAYHGGIVTGGDRLAADIEPRPDGAGYWIVDERGVVYGLDATPYGGSPSLRSGERVTSLSATPTGRGYWLFTSLGRVFPYGDAPFLGDMAGIALNGPVLDSVATPTGHGYYLVASDGGIFCFGDAAFHGSMGGIPLNDPVQSVVPTASAAGYWLVASDGGVFAFGDAPFLGSMGGTRLNAPVTGMVRFGRGYLMVGTDGGIFNFSDRPFDGSLGSSPPPSPIVAVAPIP